MMRNDHGGYLNYTEWKKKDPKSYWAMIEGREKAMKPTINKEFGELVSTFGGPKTEWDRTVAEAITGRPVIIDTGELVKEVPEFISRLAKKEKVVKVAKPEKWFMRLWNWVKGLFKSKEAEVENNEDFDFEEWTIEMSKKIIKSIREDGKADGEITCPVCFKKRFYAIMEDEHIRTNCEGCRIELVQ